jgi:diacylglycerol kinase family enzyme
VLVETEEPAAVELDGELAGRSPFTASIEPRFLQLLAPQCAPANLFCQPGISFHTIEK